MRKKIIHLEEKGNHHISVEGTDHGVLPFVFAHQRLEGNQALGCFGWDRFLAKQAPAFCFFHHVVLGSTCARDGYYAR